MKKNWQTCTVVLMLGLSSCVPQKDYYEEPPAKEVNTSEYSTEQTVILDVHYARADSKVLFYVYDQNPLIFSETSNSVTLKENIQPLDAIWTDDEGVYTGSITLPAYVKKVYAVTGALNAHILTESSINNGVLTIADCIHIMSSTPESRAIANYIYATKEDPERFNSLGWSESPAAPFDRGDEKTVGTGKLYSNYEGDNKKLKLSTLERKSLLETVNSVIGRYKTCPVEYRTAADLYINEDDTEIVLTAIGGNTCWNSSLGYYYYKEGQKPASLNDVTVYTLFPNTQIDWISGSAPNYLQSAPQGVNIGDDIQLFYFGDEQHPEYTTKFPAGYRIGFVLACNAWDAYFYGFASYTKTKNFFASSTEGLSTARPDGLDVRTAMFKDKNNNIAIAIEDFIDDQNFTDLVFCVKSNPVITNVPEVDEDNNTIISKTGIYAFEDMWPRANDYDMNDVLAQYTYEKTFNNNNRILSESFTFKTFANIAVLTNGLAFTIDNTTPATTSDFIKYQTEDFIQTKFVHEDNTVKLTDNVKSAINAEYKVTLDYGKNSGKTHETVVDAFIYRPSKDDMRLEIHCPMKKPTYKMDTSLFGTGDDCSEPDKGIFYVSDKTNVYPFAFYLSNATNQDISPLLNPDNEKVSIDQLYPKFLNWAKTGEDADWYKQ